MNRHSSLPVSVVAVALAALCGAFPAVAGNPPKDGTGTQSSIVKAARGNAKDQPKKVYTNEDIDKISGKATPLPVEPPAPNQPVMTIIPQPAVATPEGQPTAEERAARIVALEAKVTELNERIPALQKRIAAVRNPFLAPPKPPEKDREKWDQMDNVARLTQSETELADSRKELEDTLRELNALRQAP